MKTGHLLALLACLYTGVVSADSRDVVLLHKTLNTTDIDEFQAYLKAENVFNIVPTHELLRSASLWRSCKAPPFQIAPRSHWPAVKKTLQLIQALRSQGMLLDIEVVSTYRYPELNLCAGGKKLSAHKVSFAIDFISQNPELDGAALCKFWKSSGKDWKMGYNQYDSGRFHIDTHRYRRWGSYCS